MMIIGIPERHLSELAGIGAHELAHIISRRLGGSEPPFKGEGFACYSAWRIRAQTLPMGLPLHFHPAWLLSKGVRLSVAELWHRRDYTPELYDLAWSFAAFVAEQFGKERYLAFYGSGRECLRDRVDDTLGLSLAALDWEWHEHARRKFPWSLRGSPRARRWDGSVCSRAAWLGTRRVEPGARVTAGNH